MGLTIGSQPLLEQRHTRSNSRQQAQPCLRLLKSTLRIVSQGYSCGVVLSCIDRAQRSSGIVGGVRCGLPRVLGWFAVPSLSRLPSLSATPRSSAAWRRMNATVSITSELGIKGKAGEREEGKHKSYRGSLGCVKV